MPYKYDCPNCHKHHRLSFPPEEVDARCHDCGEDGCVSCMPDRLSNGVSQCDDCFATQEDNREPKADADLP